MRNNNANLLSKALAEAITETPEKNHKLLSENFLKIIKRLEFGGKAAGIIEAAEKVLMAGGGIKRILIESARPLSEESRRELERAFNKNDKIIFRIAPETIAGVKITIDDNATIDGTLQKKLKKLFSVKNS